MRCPGDFQGKWMILMSGPGAFDPVVESEICALSKMQDTFKKNNAELLVFSPDSNEAHQAWVNELEQKFPDNNISQIPLMADDGGVISKKYGILSEGATRPIRGAFIIDGQGNIRAIMIYPYLIGHNIMEIFRAFRALQEADKKGNAVLANWSVKELSEEKSDRKSEQAKQNPKATILKPNLSSVELDSSKDERMSHSVDSVQYDDNEVLDAEQLIHNDHKASSDMSAKKTIVSENTKMAKGESENIQEKKAGSNSPQQESSSALSTSNLKEHPLHPVSQSVWDAMASDQAADSKQASETPIYPVIQSVSSHHPVATKRNVVHQDNPSKGNSPKSGGSSGGIAEQNRRLLGDLLDKEDAQSGISDGRDYLITRDFPFHFDQK
ncbi:MAG TPA: hypothetical protein DEP42_00955 [Ruminococcaceae bacterium]|nr:hypothetical protein [Oscillospiraceae bacterium]